MSATSLRSNPIELPALPRPVIGVLAMVAFVVMSAVLWSLLGPLVNRPVTSVRVDGELSRLKPADIALLDAVITGTPVVKPAPLRGLPDSAPASTRPMARISSSRPYRAIGRRLVP